MIPIDCHVIQQSKIYQIITLSILLTDGLINTYHFRWNKCLSTMIIETTYTIINQLPFKLGVFHMSRTHFWLFTPNHPLLQMIKPIPRHSGLSQYKKNHYVYKIQILIIKLNYQKNSRFHPLLLPSFFVF